MRKNGVLIVRPRRVGHLQQPSINRMPMAKISASQSLPETRGNNDGDRSLRCGPRKSTIQIIRQFARAYTVIGRKKKSPLDSGIIIN